MSTKVRPIDVSCRNCGAKRGEECTQLNATGRYAVSFFHVSRQSAANDSNDNPN